MIAVKFKKLVSTHDKQKFVIEEDLPDVGAYLYVYINGKIANDYLQNDVLACQELALEEFNVPLDSWKK